MRETETHTVFQIYPSSFIWFGVHPSLPFQPDRDLVIKYALSNQEGEKCGQGSFSAALFTSVQFEHSHS